MKKLELYWQRANQYLSAQSRNGLIIIGFKLVVFLGTIDYLTGYEVSFSVFYLMPILIVTWYVGRKVGAVVAVAAAATWLLADILAGHHYRHYIIPLWNAAVRLGFFLLVLYLITALKKALDREKEAARIDHLTGLANRRHFWERAAQEISHALKFELPLSLAYIDIDNFKDFNKNYGHNQGDDLLSSMAENFKKRLTTEDMVARLGNDEFILLLPAKKEDKAKELMGQIQRDLEALVKRKNWPVTFSMAAVTYLRPHGTVEEMITQMDDLLYSTKEGEGNFRHEVTTVIPDGKNIPSRIPWESL